MKRLPRKSPNDLIRGSDWNKLVEEIETRANLIAGPGIEVKRVSAGTAIALHKHPLDRQHAQYEPDSGITPGTYSFPAMILDYMSWEDSSADPLNQPPTAAHSWKYTFHMAAKEGRTPDTGVLWPIEGMIQPISAPTIPGQTYVNENGTMQWWFPRTDAEYRAGVIRRNGIVIRGYAYNLIEQYNNLAGVQGNGVDIVTLQASNPNMTIMPVPKGTVVMVTPVASIGASDAMFVFSYENGIDGSCGE